MAQSDWNYFKFLRRPVAVGKRSAGILFGGLYLHFFAAVWFLAAPLALPAQNPVTELDFADFNGQGMFNNFSGDRGTFADKGAGIATSFDTSVFHGTNGASLRIDYSLPSGFCGIWNSLIGKDEFQNQVLNFTNLYGSLRNSSGNPSRVENVHVTNFSFWARGNGVGDFNHSVKVEFKSVHGFVGSRKFSISNQTNWTRFDFPISGLGTNDLSQMKEVVFVIEDWENAHRTNYFFLDDLAFATDEPPCDVTHLSDDVMLDLISQRAFAYFLRFTDDLGFALDRSSFSEEVSVGAIGFQLTAYCIGHQRGWADKSELENRVIRILQNLNRLPSGPEPGKNRAGYRGFFYHFLTANIGTRKNENAELSPYDTMLLMNGVLTCQEYFASNLKIQALSRQLFDRVEWNWLVDRSPGPNSKRFFLAWKPGPAEAGTFLGHVDGQTDEALMMDLLALGSKTHPVKFETYLARNRVSGSYPPADTNNILASWQGSLFNYFFLDCWIDLRRRGSDHHPSDARNLWQNNQFAVIANRRFCLDHAAGAVGGSNDLYATYGENAWGLTACDNLVAPGYPTPSEYCVFGALPTEENIRFGTKPLHAGTIAVYGAASSINFLPPAAIAALRHDFEIPNLWSPLLGFGDAYSLDPHYIEHVYDKAGNPRIHFAGFLNGPWINNMTMGVNVGPMLLAIENYRSGMIWNLTAKNPEIGAGLDRIFGPSPVVKTAALDP
jgi:hypothetical protein